MTAADQLQRLLHILPRAARKGGVALADLAAELQVSVRRVIDDIEEATARDFYHPAGGADDLQITLEPERVSVWTGGSFRRPVKLFPREALALGLGLRLRAADAPEECRHALRALGRRIEAGLATRPASDLLPRFTLEPGADDGGTGGILALLARAAREGRRCRIRYLKPGAEAPEERLLDPYRLAHAEGRWYVLAGDGDVDGGDVDGGGGDAGGDGDGGRGGDRGGDGHGEAEPVKSFRVDRTLAVELLDETFEVPADFKPGACLDGARVFRSDRDTRARVRYSPRIGRWLTERGEGEACPDGSVVVEHRVADPGWLVRHVLSHGPDAELLEPEEWRPLVREAAMRVYRAHAPGPAENPSPRAS